MIGRPWPQMSMMLHLAGFNYHLPCPGTCECTLRGKINTAFVNSAKKEGNVGKKMKPWQNPLGKAVCSANGFSWICHILINLISQSLPGFQLCVYEVLGIKRERSMFLSLLLLKYSNKAHPQEVLMGKGIPVDLNQLCRSSRGALRFSLVIVFSLASGFANCGADLITRMSSISGALLWEYQKLGCPRIGRASMSCSL